MSQLSYEGSRKSLDVLGRTNEHAKMENGVRLSQSFIFVPHIKSKPLKFNSKKGPLFKMFGLLLGLGSLFRGEKSELPGGLFLFFFLGGEVSFVRL